LFLDAQYEKVRYEGSVRSLAVLKAVGATINGEREILSVSCSLSEAEVHWRSFLEDLLKRGMHGVQLVISDNHSGLKSALKCVLPSVPWQRCVFHLAQNAGAYAPSVGLRGELCRVVKEIYQAVSRTEAEARLKRAVETYSEKAKRFSDWLEESFVEGLSFYSFPKEHWKK